MRLKTPHELGTDLGGDISPNFFRTPVPQVRWWKTIVIPLALLALSALPSSALADFIFTASGSGKNGALSAEADFIIGTNTITVVLKNRQTDIGSAGQAISGLT